MGLHTGWCQEPHVDKRRNCLSSHNKESPNFHPKDRWYRHHEHSSQKRNHTNHNVGFKTNTFGLRKIWSHFVVYATSAGCRRRYQLQYLRHAVVLGHMRCQLQQTSSLQCHCTYAPQLSHTLTD